MEPIQKSLKKVTSSPDFKKRLDGLKKEVLKDYEVKAFIKEHEEQITDEVLEKSMMKLYEFIGQEKNCNGCESLHNCKNMLKGYKPVLFLERNRIDVHYEECETKIQEDEKKQFASLFQSMYIPKEVLNASISNLYHDHGRYQVVQHAVDFLEKYQAGKFSKGLYLHGSFGIGKTYLLAAIANELAKNKVKSLLIYTPEFMREIKNSFKDQSTNEKVESIKRVPVLMFDDIGAELMSSWFRDEILGTILQYRMMEQLPVFFSSNLSYEELEHHLTYSQRGEVEEIKAARIMERIKYLTTSIEMGGKNYRME